MRLFFFIITFSAATCFGQTYEKFTDYSAKGLHSNRNSLSAYYEHFLSLLSKRDTAYLKEKLAKTRADKIYLIEGYNFETGRYGLFEEYKIRNDSIALWGNSEFYLDKKPQKIASSYFLFDAALLREDSIAVDTLFPRKYRYGTGCVLTDTKFKTARLMEQKASQDGIIIEKYCRIETFIDNTTNKIFIRYYFPVSGQREFEFRAGMMTDYPPGLDFWLFASPYFLDE